MSIGVKLRLEVLKRDRFTCAYCGAHPPDVLLEIDHVVPRAAGGSDDMENLVTACWDCNRGKGDRLLDEGGRPAVSAKTVEQMEERLAQAKAYMELLGGLANVADQQIRMVIEHWAHAFGATAHEEDGGSFWRFDNTFGGTDAWPNEASLRRVLRSLPLVDVLEAADIAAAKFRGTPGTPATSYFFGVCYRAIKQGTPVSSPPVPTLDVATIEERAWKDGREFENQRIRHYFLGREEYGLETFADVVAALWPEDDE